MGRTLLIYILLCLESCHSEKKNVTVFKKDSVLPEMLVNDPHTQAAANEFCLLFKKATGIQLKIAKKVSTGTNPIIELLINAGSANRFQLSQEQNKLRITSGTEDGLKSGIRYFFSTYVNPSKDEVESKHVSKVNVPQGLYYIRPFAFEYREPYFPDNFDRHFRETNHTTTIEETWGLWGHNISKAIKITPGMQAQINGSANNEQFCFSSHELESALISFINTQLKKRPGVSRFMIMPNDNDLVCQCKRCKELGNTNLSASPAVFTLINELSAKFPHLQFFSSAYSTTWLPPSFKLAPNAGVMVSTMSFPKGVVLEQSDKRQWVENSFTNWRKVCSLIYVWDYGVNFDNYFDAYPVIAIAQKNFQFFKRLGVKGIFMEGSEDSYTAYADLKCYLYAQLMIDTDIDLKAYTYNFLKNKYPSVADLLFDYYTAINQRALLSARTLDIYGGISQARKKYLNEPEFDAFYESFFNKVSNLDSTEVQALRPLLLSVVFTKLELLRTNGISKEGYAHCGENGSEAVIDAKVPALLKRLEGLSAITGIQIYNESAVEVANYLRQWETEILARPYRNLLLGKSLKFISKPDEDYPNAAALSDGAIGFDDYYNNWIISSSETFAVELDAMAVQPAKVFEMNFLNDPRHKIYFPGEVSVITGKKKFSVRLPPDINNSKREKYRVCIPVQINSENKTVEVQVIKQPQFKGGTVASDEIFFRQ